MHLGHATSHRSERVIRAVPHGASAWTQALQTRERHCLLVPVARIDDGEIALRYIVARVVPSVARVHLVNVQPVPTAALHGDLRVDASLAQRLHVLDAERMLVHVRRHVERGALRVTSEVAFGSPAETLCAIAQPQRFSGIVIGRRCFSLDDFIGRSTLAKILELARVPVTLVHRRTIPGSQTHERDRATLAERRPGARSSQVPEESPTQAFDTLPAT